MADDPTVIQPGAHPSEAAANSPDPGRGVSRLASPAVLGNLGRSASGFCVDSRIPGGNGVVRSIADDVVLLRADPRDTGSEGRYWSLRVRGAGGQSVSFVFDQPDTVGANGPAVSFDEGLTWQWLGNSIDSRNSFRFAFPARSPSVRLSIGPAYVDLHWQRFCGLLSPLRTVVREGILCLSRKGRSVPRLHVGQLNGKPRHRIVLTARHFAGEAAGNYALEGVVLAALEDDETGAWFREHAEMLVVPFVDRDGVEDGDPGRNRRPIDYFLDYGATSVHPEIRALREWVGRWSGGRLEFMADLHGPWDQPPGIPAAIRQVCPPDQPLSREQLHLGRLLAGATPGPLSFAPTASMTLESAPEALAGPVAGIPATVWFSAQQGMRLATAFSVPPAVCSGVPVTADALREFGRSFAQAIRQYLEEAEDPVPMARIYMDPEESMPLSTSLRPQQESAPASPANAGAAKPGAPRIVIRATKPKSGGFSIFTKR